MKTIIFCFIDQLSFPRIVRDRIELVILNQDIAENGHCKCIVDGKQECSIVLEELLANPKPRKLRSNSRATKYLRKFCGSGKKILDLGCWNGEVGHWLGKDNEVVGLDICPKNIATAFNNSIIAYKSVVSNDGLNLPFENSYFDTVVALEVIEHTLDTRGFISEIYRVLKPGGQLLISCPNLVSIWNRLSILFGSGMGLSLGKFLQGKWTIFNRCLGLRYPDQDLHLRFFTPKSLTKFLEGYGFKKKYIFGSDAIISNLGLGGVLKNWCESIWGVFEKK